MSDQKIDTIEGGRTKKSFQVYFDPHKGLVYIKAIGGFFSGGKTLIRGQKAKDAQHAVRIAQAHVTDK